MFTITIEAGFGDIDGLKHVNNTVLARWFEQARTPFFRFFTPDLDLSYEKWKLIMARTEFDFLGQLKFDLPIEIRSYIEKIGNSSFTILQQAWQNDELKVQGKAVTVHFNFLKQKSVPIPDGIREKLSHHLFSAVQ